ncbi:uncharacterized protein PRCAT00004660001 [Priceomyces carsonii]|uniref:uncharacterized protein n=1 Tax=Priceomyces carsonii TaxID=28549 RepID=UPI002EDB72AE|nr:unnamed protein product [Priceomyces carsonii]
MATGLPVQMAMNNSHKQMNGTITNHTGIPETNPSSVLNETTAATWLAIGSLAESLGDLEKALASYDAALRHSPNNPDALTSLANIYRSKDVFFKAAELYEQALNYNPENGETWGLLGHCYLMLDDLQRAYAAYQRALYYLDNPNVPKLWHGIGILYDRYGSLEYAEEAFVRVLELDPNFEKSNEIYFRLGIIYKHQGKLQNALECFQYILNNPPHPLTQPDVWFQIGSVLEQQKDGYGAKEAYEKVLQVNPQHAKVLQQLGCLYSQADISASSSLNSSNPPFVQDLNVALKYLTQSLEIDLSDAHSWYYLGRVHMIRGDFNAAYEAFQQAVNRDSRNPTFWCSIGVLYYQISQYRDALDAYTRAIRLNPYISEVWYDLGTLYETCNNQISDALDAYRQAERLDPENPHIKARLDQLIKYQQEGNTHPPKPPPVSQQPKLPQGMVLESTQSPQQPQIVTGQQPPHHLAPPSLPQPVQLPPQQPGLNIPTAAPPVQVPQMTAVPQISPLLHQPSTTNLPPLTFKPPVSPMLNHKEPIASKKTLKKLSGSETTQTTVVPKEGKKEHSKEYKDKLQGDVNNKSLTSLHKQTNGKHDLEDKKDSKTLKKGTVSPKVLEDEKTQKTQNAQEQKEQPQGNNKVEPKPQLNSDSVSKITEDKGAELKEEKGVDKTEESEEKKTTEPLEPPLRKVDEDENYDDD